MNRMWVRLSLVFAAVVILSVPVFLWLAKGIFAPLERMTKTMKRVESGDLSARNGQVGTRDEIGLVAGHLDSLLNQVQDRDRRLRAWADELNQRVEQRTEELRDANAKLEETYKQLVMSEKLASIGEITAGVAHEINNPVAVIQGNVDVIREALGDKTAPVETELQLIDRQVTRIEAIVGKLLQFARPGEFSSCEDSVLLPPLVQDCLVLVEHLLARKEITVEILAADAPAVRIDTGEMQQVVINLLVNAIQAMGDQGKLTLIVRPEHRQDVPGACLVVRDTGPGIPPERRATVFDPFFTTKIGEGTGLGLSISQTIIQRAGGIISVDSPKAGGTEFHVWLPEAETQDLAAQ